MIKRTLSLIVMGIGKGFIYANAIGLILIFLLGILNWIFDFWIGIPIPIIYVACVMGFIQALKEEFYKKQEFRVGQRALEWIVLFGAVVVGMVLVVLILTSQFPSWFEDGGKAWTKLFFTQLALAILGGIIDNQGEKI